MTTVTVRFFGPARDATGVASAEYQLVDPATLGTLREMIFAQYAGLAAGATALRFAVNLDYADTDVALSDGDEVAVIPPVAGGSPNSDDGTVAIVEAAIDLTQCVEQAAAHEAGAVCTFIGTVRAEGEGSHKLIALEYSAYGEMALRKLGEIRATALARFDVTQIVVVHRVGRLALGETSVAVVVSAPHRGASFDACRFVMETLKATVPIWKKEHFSDGQSAWVDPTAEALREGQETSSEASDGT